MASKRRIANAKRAVYKRRQREAALASGRSNPLPTSTFVITPAAWMEATTYVSDHQFVEADYGDAGLAAQAQKRLLWGHRLFKRQPPFHEALLRLDRSIDDTVEKERSRKRKKNVQTKEAMHQSVPVAASGVRGETLRAESGTRRHVPNKPRPVQALLATGVLRPNGSGEEEGDVDMTHEPELREKAQALRQQGLLIREIADQVPVPIPTLIRWLNPTLEARERVRARKKKYSLNRRCPKCHHKMSNSAQMCAECFNKEQKYWTRERVVEAIQKWAIEKGHAPTYQEWVKSGPGHPAIWTIIDGNNPAFESWSDAIKASGYTPRKHRGPGRMSPAERAEMRRKARENALKRALAKENA